MATPTLAAIVPRSRTSASPKRPSSRVLWTLMTPMASSPTTIGTPTQDSAGVPMARHREPVELRRPVEQQRLSRRQDARRQTAAHRHRILRLAEAVLDVIREPDDVLGLVLEGHERDVGREGLAHLLADQLEQRREVELRRDRLADPVDRVELRDTLARLVDQPRVLERDAEAGREGRQQPHVAVGERVRPVEVLERDAAADLVADHQRDADDRQGWLALDDRHRAVFPLVRGDVVVDDGPTTGDEAPG